MNMEHDFKQGGGVVDGMYADHEIHVSAMIGFLSMMRLLGRRYLSIAASGDSGVGRGEGEACP